MITDDELAVLIIRACSSRNLFIKHHFVHVLENITFCSLFAYPFHDFNHHSNQQQPPLPLLIGDIRSSAKQSLAVYVSCW